MFDIMRAVYVNHLKCVIRVMLGLSSLLYSMKKGLMLFRNPFTELNFFGSLDLHANTNVPSLSHWQLLNPYYKFYCILHQSLSLDHLQYQYNFQSLLIFPCVCNQMVIVMVGIKFYMECTERSFSFTFHFVLYIICYG